MQLQARDQEILASVFKYGILSSEQIGLLHFKSVHHTVVMRRLRILEKEKLLTRIDSLPKSQSAWSLSVAGARIINVEPPARFSNRNTTLHDVTVAQVRMSLEAVGLGHEFSSEWELRKRLPAQSNLANKFLQIPDGIFVAEENATSEPKVVALEIELNAKNHQRYRLIIDHYQSIGSISYVWYFVSSEAIARTIHGQWRAASNTNPTQDFIFSVIDDGAAHENPIRIWSARANTWIEIQSVFKLPFKSDEAGPAVDSSLGR